MRPALPQHQRLLELHAPQHDEAVNGMHIGGTLLLTEFLCDETAHDLRGSKGETGTSGGESVPPWAEAGDAWGKAGGAGSARSGAREGVVAARITTWWTRTLSFIWTLYARLIHGTLRSTSRCSDSTRGAASPRDLLKARDFCAAFRSDRAPPTAAPLARFVAIVRRDDNKQRGGEPGRGTCCREGESSVHTQ